jgi:hypothetical protein
VDKPGVAIPALIPAAEAKGLPVIHIHLHRRDDIPNSESLDDDPLHIHAVSGPLEVAYSDDASQLMNPVYVHVPSRAELDSISWDSIEAEEEVACGPGKSH